MKSEFLFVYAFHVSFFVALNRASAGQGSRLLKLADGAEAPGQTITPVNFSGRKRQWPGPSPQREDLPRGLDPSSPPISGAPCAGDKCLSPLWTQFRNDCYAFLPALLTNSFGIDKARDLCKVSGAEIVSINSEDENTFITATFEKEGAGSEEIFLGMFFDTDANGFRWYDNSEVTFTNWAEEDASGELLNTCAALHRHTGTWRKISCDNFTEMGTLCKARLYSQRKRTSTDQKAFVASMVIVFSMLISIASLVLVVQCKRNVWSLRPSSTSHQPVNIAVVTDESVLVDAEEREFCA